jgi:hypothetical protein
MHLMLPTKFENMESLRLSSNYALYADLSNRVMSILSDYLNMVLTRFKICAMHT